MLQTGRFEFTVLDFLILNSFWSLVCFGFRASNFGFTLVEVGSDFDIRISDLFLWLLGAIRFFPTTVGSTK